MAILLKITADDKGRPVIQRLKNDIDSLDKTVEKSAKKQQSVLGKLSGAWKMYGAMLTTGAVAATAMAINKFVNMASAAEETANKFSVIFEGANNVTGAIQKMQKETGYATSSLQEMASGIGALVKPVGFSADKTFELSKRITALSLDIGSFMNLAPQDVVLNFQSALAGSSETLQKYGIDARETTLAQQAFNMGLISSAKQYEKLDPEEKRRVRTLALIEKAFLDTKSAQGDLARTSTSYANVSRTTDEKVKEFGETLGKILQPKLGAVKKLFGEGAEAATNFLKAITETPSEKTATEKQIEFLDEYVKGYKAQKEIEVITNKNVNDLLKSNFDFQVQFNAATNERTKILQDQLTADQDSSRLGKEQIVDAGSLFDSEYRVKNILESQLGTRELNLENIDKAVKKLMEVKTKENEIKDATTKTAEVKRSIILQGELIKAHAKETAEANKDNTNEIREVSVTMPQLVTSYKNVVAQTRNWQDGVRALNLNLAETLNKMAEIVELSKGRMSFSKLLKMAGIVATMIPGGQGFAPIFSGAGNLAGSFGFQHGGSFIVPGSGSPDSKMVAFKATPGEQVSINKPGQSVSNNNQVYNLNIQTQNIDALFVRTKLIPMLQDAQRFGAKI